MERSIFSLLRRNIEVQNEDTFVSLGDEQVLRLYIAMADAFLVQILKTDHYLFKNVFCHFFCVFMLVLRGQMIEDFHAVDVLHHEVDLVPERIVELFDSLHNVMVAKLLDDFSFLDLSLTLFFVVLTAQLDRVDGSVILDKFASINACTATLAQLLAKSIFGAEAAGCDTLCLCVDLVTFPAQEIHVRLVCLTSPQLVALVSTEERIQTYVHFSPL